MAKPPDLFYLRVCRSPSNTDGEPVWRIVKRECIVRRATAVRNWVSPIVKRFRAFFGEGYKSNGCLERVLSQRPTLLPATRGETTRRVPGQGSSSFPALSPMSSVLT